MDGVIFGGVCIWLGILSWFDIHRREIPHSAWMVIPLIGAGAYRIWQGDGSLVLLTILVISASERARIAGWIHLEEIGRVMTWFPLLFLGLFFAVQTSPVTALAILGFWIGWELKGWGGADALAATTVCLIWPGWTFLLAFLATHLLVVLGMGTSSILRERRIQCHRLPGLPLLLVSVILFSLAQTLLLFRWI